MVNNIEGVAQYGLSSADICYEMCSGGRYNPYGSICRLSVSAEIGSVRSVRHYFLDCGHSRFSFIGAESTPGYDAVKQRASII